VEIRQVQSHRFHLVVENYSGLSDEVTDFAEQWLLCYACRQNTHLRKVNSVFGGFASLATGTF
jgi:hypothetical protein